MEDLKMEENTTNNIVNETEDSQVTEVKTYTQEEVLALLQSETDKRVSQALKTQQKKYEKQLSLSKLDGDERAKAESNFDIAMAMLREGVSPKTVRAVFGLGPKSESEEEK